MAPLQIMYPHFVGDAKIVLDPSSHGVLKAVMSGILSDL